MSGYDRHEPAYFRFNSGGNLLCVVLAERGAKAGDVLRLVRVAARDLIAEDGSLWNEGRISWSEVDMIRAFNLAPIFDLCGKSEVLPPT